MGGCMHQGQPQQVMLLGWLKSDIGRYAGDSGKHDGAGQAHSGLPARCVLTRTWRASVALRRQPGPALGDLLACGPRFGAGPVGLFF